MKSSYPGWALVGLLPLVAISGCGRSHVWNGTWQLNTSKSSVPGPAFSISITPAGEYHVESGVTSYSFACNGKEYPTSPQQTMSCVQKTPLVFDTAAKKSGKEVGTAHWELSADGKLLTVLSVPTGGKEPVKPTESSYERDSGSTGFAGGWKIAKPFAASPKHLQLAQKDQTLHIAFPDIGQYADVTLDGSDAAMHGPSVPNGLTISITPQGPQELATLNKFNGTVVNQGYLRISADGRSLQEEFGPPGSTQKTQLVYDKQ